MSDFSIKCNYELPPLLRVILGAEHLNFYAERFRHFYDDADSYTSIDTELHLSALFNIYEQKEACWVKLTRQWEDSFAGDLYRFEANGEILTEKDILSRSCITAFGPVVSLVGIGEVKGKIIEPNGTWDEESDVAYWFGERRKEISAIIVDVKTIQHIGIGLNGGRWLYLTASAVGNINLSLVTKTAPEEFCAQISSPEFDYYPQIIESIEADILIPNTPNRVI
jgi:hypothetical protein